MCALMLNITSSTGLEIKNAYVRVDEYSCFGNVVNGRLRAYVSKELANNGASSIEGSEYIITIEADYGDNADNTKKQIYNHAKNTEKYANSVDV